MPATDEPVEMMLCEVLKLQLQPDVLYIFRVVPGCKACEDAAEIYKVKWVIRHPSQNHDIECASFEECMDKYFEGYNLPYQILHGVRDTYNVAYARVTEWMKKK